MNVFDADLPVVVKVILPSSYAPNLSGCDSITMHNENCAHDPEARRHTFLHGAISKLAAGQYEW